MNRKQQCHLISVYTTMALKALAITMVVIGHYYRYCDISVHFLSSIGFWGAALFAFLSGYGCMASYYDKGIKVQGGYLLNKIYKIYCPFLFINILTIVVYGYSSESLIKRIFLGIDDPIMWYPIFIIGFYTIFFILYSAYMKEFVKITCICSIGVLYCFIAFNLRVGSQWYTATGALIAGVLVGNMEEILRKRSKKQKEIIIVIMASILVISTVLAKIFAYYLAMKDIMTIISGGSFSLLIFMISVTLNHERKILVFVGKYSYWVYLIHMKVFYLIEKMNGTKTFFSFSMFIILTLLLSVGIGKLWDKFNGKKNNSTTF